MRPVLAVILLSACAPTEYGLGVVEPGPAAESWTQVPLPANGSAVDAQVDPASGLRRESFQVGPDATTPLQDFLFVIDDSHSMRRLRGPVTAGLASLEERGVFPDRSRVAITHMTPADPDAESRRPHPLVRSVKRVRKNPGFQRLVSDRGLDRRTRGEQGGCDAWFAPGDVAANGERCLSAHTRLSYGSYRVEDGLVALSQLLERRDERGLFRQGAAVNVVFVSDTQPPGYVPHHDDDDDRWLAFEDLEDLRPDWATLREQIDQRHDLAALRVHAIAPERSCGEDWEGLAPLYQEAAIASGGVVADICTTDDYAAVVAQIVAIGGELTAPLLALGAEPSQVLAVQVDGVDVAYRTQGHVLALDADALNAGARATVVYEPTSW